MIRRAKHDTQQQTVITWFKVYAGFMMLLYVAVAGFGLFLASSPEFFDNAELSSRNAPADGTEALIMGVMYIGLGVVLAAAFLAGLFAPRRFWGWVYNLVLICIGLTSCCLWPATIPLLIFWIKEDTRTWYKNQAV